MDYGAQSTLLMFDECKRRSCVNISIEDDLVLEMEESFNVTLKRTIGLDSRIELSPMDGVIEIIENDGMMLMMR